MIYIADDGSYGDAGEMMLVDTSEWTGWDYRELEEAGDSGRVETARKIATRHKQEYSKVMYGQLWKISDGKVM
jgi:hypothetical protein